eukprot:7287468-Prymnesium_polylepis.1
MGVLAGGVCCGVHLRDTRTAAGDEAKGAVSGVVPFVGWLSAATFAASRSCVAAGALVAGRGMKLAGDLGGARAPTDGGSLGVNESGPCMPPASRR